MIPELEGKLDGFALRVPTPDGSATDLVAELETEVTAEEAQRRHEGRRRGARMKGILQYQDDPIVSIDVDRQQPLLDLRPGADHGQGQARQVVSWYDNEWGYSCRLVDLVQRVL